MIFAKTWLGEESLHNLEEFQCIKLVCQLTGVDWILVSFRPLSEKFRLRLVSKLWRVWKIACFMLLSVFDTVIINISLWRLYLPSDRFKILCFELNISISEDELELPFFFLNRVSVGDSCVYLRSAISFFILFLRYINSEPRSLGASEPALSWPVSYHNISGWFQED